MHLTLQLKFSMKLRVWLTALVMGFLSLALFLFRINTPPAYFYDEGAYVQSARTFLSGAADTNPQHPPLAKFIIAGGLKVFGDNPFGWRFASAVCGSLTLVALFLWTYLLLNDFALSLIAAGLTLFNNFLFVMSRVAMLDVFYFAFVIMGILAFTAAIMSSGRGLFQKRTLMLCSGLMFGIGTACKWNAVVTLAAVILIAAFLFFVNSHGLRQIGSTTLLVCLVFVPILTYCLAFWPLYTEMHRAFTIRQLIASNIFIWSWHVHCPGNPMLNVPWYDWFFRAKPERAFGWLMGNFVVVWGGLPALMLCGWRLWKRRSEALPEAMVIIFYAVNLLQWLVIPQKMTCYYYYYPPAMFLGVAIVIALSRAKMKSIAGLRISLIIVIAAAAFFLYCYPRMANLEAPFDCALGCWS